MRKTIIFIVVVLIVSATAMAQAPAPTASLPMYGQGEPNEFFVGYMYQPTDWGTTNTNGFDVNYTRFFGARFGAVADVDYASANNKTNISALAYRVGARMNLVKNARIQPYIHFLAGGANLNADVYYPPAAAMINKSWHGFTWAGGGGVDFRLTHHFGARFQGDWAHLPYGTHDSSDWQRLAIGATWKW